MPEIRTYPDAASLVWAAAEHFATLAAEAIAVRGRFAVALSGGSTPRATYTLLAGDEFAARVDWPRVHVFWGRVLFLVTGAAKAEILQAVLEGPEGLYPAQQIHPTSGYLTWLVDTAAAGRLKGQA